MSDPLQPYIFGFDELFAIEKNNAEAKHGLPAGSIVHLFGPTGCGKTIFALAFLRSLLWSENSSLIYLVTPEIRPERTSTSFESLGWLIKKAAHLEAYDPLAERIRLVEVTERNRPRPILGADEQINSLINSIRDLEKQTRHEGRRFVLIDNLNVILKDSRDPADFSRNVQDLIARLHDVIRTKANETPRLALTVLTSNDPLTDSMTSCYADYVFSLKMQPIGRGRVRRTMSVLKSQGTGMRVGDHSWVILRKNALTDVVVSRRLKQYLERNYFRFAEPNSTKKKKHEVTTIAIFTRPKLPPIGNLNHWEFQGEPEQQPSPRIWTGIPGLDEMLLGDTDFFVQSAVQPRNERSRPCALKPASVTLLVGKSGTGKTTACLQFLLADSTANENSLYVNFENRPARIREAFPASALKLRELHGVSTIYRRHAELDMNLLLAEIKFLIRRCNIRRLAIDGLSDLLATMAQGDHSRFLEDLLTTIRYANLCSYQAAEEKDFHRFQTAVLIALEADLEEEAYSTLEAISFAADNLIALKQVFINNEQRKTARVVKARGMRPDGQYREVLTRTGQDEPLQIVAGLENYAGIHSGNPEPVVVTLQLLEENEAEKKFNAAIESQLPTLFGYKVLRFGFSRGEISRTLQDIAIERSRIPQSNVKILSIDEWWIREMQLHAGTPYKSYIPTEHPLLRLDPASPPAWSLIRPGDYWIFEVEKSSVSLINASEPEVLEHSETHVSNRRFRNIESRMVACPSYMDFGMFCLHPATAKTLGLERQPYSKWLARVPRVWANQAGKWYARPDAGAEHPTIVDIMAMAKERTCAVTGFAFDMETPATFICAFLEFCWSFGAREDFLIKDVATWGLNRSTYDLSLHPATKAVEFLCFLVAEGLMRPFTGLDDTRHAAFSRHWFSSLSFVNERQERGNDDMPFITPLPFFPVGLGSEHQKSMSFGLAIHDALVRLDQLIKRAAAALLYRMAPSSYCDALNELRELAEPVTHSLQLYKFETSGQISVPSDDDLKGIINVLETRGSLLAEWFLTNSEVFNQREPAGVREWLLAVETNEDMPEGEWPTRAGGGIEYRSCQHLGAAKYLDITDVFELLRWHELRVEIIKAERDRRTLSNAVHGDVEGLKRVSEGEISALTGYCCEGSWMVGVERKTQSPVLATKFIAEICSANRAAERAKIGGGIPARKDFYALHEEEMVCLSDQSKRSLMFNWSELLKFCGARGRRRDRVLCSQIAASDVFEVIRREVHHSLKLSGGLANAYKDSPESIYPELKLRALAAVETIFGAVADLMRRRPDCEVTGKAPCLACPCPRECARLRAQQGAT